MIGQPATGMPATAHSHADPDGRPVQQAACATGRCPGGRF